MLKQGSAKLELLRIAEAVANEKSIDIGSIKDLTLRYYRLYEEYAEEAYKYEKCPPMPVDDQKKLLKAYKN